MTSGGALLIALLSQSPIGAAREAPPAAPTPTLTKARIELRGAAADCVSRAEIASRVAARTPRVQFADDAAIYARVAVTSTRPGNVVAEVVLATAGAEQPARRFVARTCAEAADAIAVIIAVTLDPTLKSIGVDASGGGAEAGSNEHPAAPSEKPLEEAVADKPPAPPVTVAPAAPPPAAARRHFAASAAGQTIFGPAPAVMPGVALYGMAALDREGFWAPALIVGATHVWRNDLAEPGGAASFTLDAASVDACPLRLGQGTLVARPCASALIGRLGASGADTDQGASFARPFATAGVALAASWGTTIQVSARVAVGMTLVRYAYEFGSTTFDRANPITVAANLGVGLGWP